MSDHWTHSKRSGRAALAWAGRSRVGISRSSGAPSASTSLPAGEDGGGEVSIVALPKFIVGHPVLGAIPIDPEADPVWEV